MAAIPRERTLDNRRGFDCLVGASPPVTLQVHRYVSVAHALQRLDDAIGNTIGQQFLHFTRPDFYPGQGERCL